ncbi:MAG TPA: carboxypeptidase-like regulatory domain-containing protein [Candidatus Thermoplasmatota archaeon]|nr:carboxypeptidase-like regulatory domain-containing protein [Candidatus Thermoplasmatota archaeon]
MRTLATLMACLIALAGCSTPAEPEPAGEVLAVEALELEATDTTGVIRGIVVDEAIRPVAGAEVTLRGAGEAVTASTEEGALGFDGLEPGTYFLKVSKPGYSDLQLSADVVAGVAEPVPVKAILPRLAGYLPYVTVRVFDGFIECTTSFLVLCGAPNLLTGDNLTNDRYTWTWFFEPNATLMQAEMVWESTQSLSPTLYFEMEPSGDCDDGFFNRTEGESPIYATLNATQIEEGPLDLECGIYFSLFSGHNEPLPRQPVTGWGIGATAQQRFTLYAHAFYDFLPTPGWRFTVDGEPAVPDS